MVTPSLKDKKRAVDIVRNIETDISFNIAIGSVVMATTAVLGIPDPLLWGTLAAVLSFAPYVGEFAIVILLSLAGIMTFDNLLHALVAPAIYFVVMTICWQGVAPFVVGRRMTLSPLAVFVMIIVLGWMWGSYWRSGCRTGARQLEDYLRPYWVVAPDCRVLKPLAQIFAISCSATAGRSDEEGRASTSLGGAFRLHRDQFLNGVHLAVNEDDVGNLDRCPACDCRFEVTGAETQHRSEEI